MKKDENNKIKTKTKQKIKENRMKKKDAILFFFFFVWQLILFHFKCFRNGPTETVSEN